MENNNLPFHIEIIVEYDTSKSKQYNESCNECEEELRKWLWESPILHLTFHGIQYGICAHMHNSDYQKALETYDFLSDFQLLDDLEYKYSVKIKVCEPWK